jgi:hypothetical protein
MGKTQNARPKFARTGLPIRPDSEQSGAQPTENASAEVLFHEREKFFRV